MLPCAFCGLSAEGTLETDNLVCSKSEYFCFCAWAISRLGCIPDTFCFSFANTGESFSVKTKLIFTFWPVRSWISVKCLGQDPEPVGVCAPWLCLPVLPGGGVHGGVTQLVYTLLVFVWWSFDCWCLCGTSLIVGVCVTQLWLLVFVSQFCLPALPGGIVHRGVTTGLYFDCWCLCDKALIVGLCVTHLWLLVFASQFCLPALPRGSVHRGVTTGLCFDCWCWCDTALIVDVGVTQLWLLVLVWHSFDCWCWCDSFDCWCDTALMLVWHSFDCWCWCDTAFFVGVGVTQLCLPALPGGGVHRGVTAGLCFDCWCWCDTVPGDGVHRGVTAGLCFDCWCWCDTVPGDGVDRGVATVWCFVSHSFAFLPYLKTVYTEVLQLVYVFDCWCLCDTALVVGVLCDTALIVGVCVIQLWLLVFCVTQLCLPALPGDGVRRGAGAGGLPSCGHQEGCHCHPGSAVSVCPRNLLQHALRWCWKWWAVLWLPFRKRSDFWNLFDGYIFCTCASLQFSCFGLSLCGDWFCGLTWERVYT